MNNMDDFEVEESDDLYEHHRFTVDPKQSPIRLDKYLQDKIRNASRNKIQQGIELGYVKVNDSQQKTSYKIKPADVITVLFPEPPRDTDVVPENIPLNILYEDDDLLIVNKPAGMVVHPAFNNWSGTLVNALTWHFQHLPTMPGNDGRPGLVHRIDKDTSGLLVIAKNEWAMTHLAQQFFHHTISRTYIAIIWGVPQQLSGTIDVFLGRSFKDRRLTEAFPNADFGRNAVTHFEVLEDLRYVSVIQCKLETGRTHQIRAHMKYLGHPIFNDEMYGGSNIVKGSQFTKYKQFVDNCFSLIPRQALHAKTLGFIHPSTKQWVEFNTDLPHDMQAAIEKWKNYVKYE